MYTLQRAIIRFVTDVSVESESNLFMSKGAMTKIESQTNDTYRISHLCV